MLNRTTPLGTLIGALLLLSFASQSANAAITVYQSQSGESSPLGQYWTRNFSGTSGNWPTEAAIPADGAWEIRDTSTSSPSSLFYSIVPEDAAIGLGDTEGWTLSTELRVVNANDAVDNGVQAEYNDGDFRWILNFGSTALGDAIVRVAAGSGNLTHTTPGGSVYHTYELVYDAVSGTADLLVDGVEVFSNFSGVAAGGVQKRLIFGAGGSSTTGRAYYRNVSLSLDLPDEPALTGQLDGFPLAPELAGEIDILDLAGPSFGREIASFGTRVAITGVGGVHLYQLVDGQYVFEETVDVGLSPRELDLGDDVLTVVSLEGEASSSSYVNVYARDSGTGVWDRLWGYFAGDGDLGRASISDGSVYVGAFYAIVGAQGQGSGDGFQCVRIDQVGGEWVRAATVRYKHPAFPSRMRVDAVSGKGDRCYVRDATGNVLRELPLGPGQFGIYLGGGAYPFSPSSSIESLSNFSSVGRTLKVEGDQFIVGALRNSSGAGALLTYQMTVGGSETQTDIIDGSLPSFGTHFAINSEFLATHEEDAGTSTELFLYSKSGNAWGPPTQIPSRPVAYGNGLALSGDRVLSDLTVGGISVIGNQAGNPGAVAAFLRSQIYVDAGADPTSAAFRYKRDLYSGATALRKKVEVDNGNPDARVLQVDDGSVEDIWGPTERDVIGSAECAARVGLEISPTDIALGDLLLDLHYDRTAGDLIIANRLRRAGDRARLLPPMPSLPVIDQEIAAHTQTLDAYLDALEGGPVPCARPEPTGYFHLIEDGPLLEGSAITEYSPGIPAGYGIFLNRVPNRPLEVAVDDVGNPIDLGGNLFEGYKDLGLVVGGLNDYAEIANELAWLHYRRGDPNDREMALALLEDAGALLALRANQLQATFDAQAVAAAGSGIEETLESLRAQQTRLGRSADEISTGANPLGFDDDFLLVVNDPSSNFTDSYDVFESLLVSGDCPSVGTTSFLELAACDFEDAALSYETYQLGLAAVTTQFALLNESDALRLTEIGDENQTGSEIWQQALSIEAAKKRVDRNRVEISNLEARIRIEVERRAEEKKIKNAMGAIRLSFSTQQISLTNKIADINATQKAADSFAKLFSIEGAITGLVNVANGVVQSGGEKLKGDLGAEKERLAALETAELKTQEGNLLGLESRSRIASWLLEMNTLAVDSQVAAILLRQEVGRLTQLVREKEFLETRSAGRLASFARRYQADPVFELRADDNADAANRSFDLAQEWLFYMARALEYKWIRQYRDDSPSTTGFSMEEIYRLRNAQELRGFFLDMVALETPADLTSQPAVLYSEFSLREDFLGLTSDPEDDAAFLNELFTMIRAGSDCDGTEISLGVDQCIVLELSTVREQPDFFSRGQFADKIETFGLRVEGSGAISSSSLVAEILYGGTSYLRQPEVGSEGSREDLLQDEILTYSTKNHFSTGNGWESRPAKRRSLQIPSASGEAEGDFFQDLSVAVSGWRIMLPVFDGQLILNLPQVDDLILTFDHTAYDRQ